MSTRARTKEFKAELLKYSKLWRRGKPHGQVRRASFDNGDEFLSVELENVDLADGERVAVQIGDVEVIDLIITRRGSRGQVSTSGSHTLPAVGDGDAVDVVHDSKVLFRGTFKTPE